MTNQNTIPYIEALEIAKAILGIGTLDKKPRTVVREVRIEAKRVYKSLNARIGGGGGYGVKA